MSSAVLHRLRRISFGWLLGLLLFLPLAQSMAAWHEVSHLGGPSGSSKQAEPAPRDGVPLPHGEVCDLCMAAIAVDAGGLPAMMPFIAASDAKPALISVETVAVWLTFPVAAYRSRAPPRVAV